MKISYDQATDSLYIHLADSASVDSDEVIAGVVLDYDINTNISYAEDDTIVEIVQLDARKRRENGRQ